jgi:hypothetical protein
VGVFVVAVAIGPLTGCSSAQPEAPCKATQVTGGCPSGQSGLSCTSPLTSGALTASNCVAAKDPDEYCCTVGDAGAGDSGLCDIPATSNSPYIHVTIYDDAQYAPTTGGGGEIVGGTYYLTAQTLYGCTGASSISESAVFTAPSATGGTLSLSSQSSSGTSYSVWNYLPSGASLGLRSICGSDVSAGDISIVSYTATPTQVILVVPDSTCTDVSTFTLVGYSSGGDSGTDSGKLDASHADASRATDGAGMDSESLDAFQADDSAEAGFEAAAQDAKPVESGTMDGSRDAGGDS